MYRVHNFNELIGNVTTLSIIKRSLTRHKFPETTLFSGVMGTGKSSSALLVGLALTCENPNEDGPCMKCKTCKENLKAIENNGRGKQLYKVNIGLLVKDKKNIQNLIKEIFVLEQGEGNTVYILEEMHAMSSEDQTALLEEVDRKAPGTYIIMCTTQPNKVIPELRSRAIKFNFARLKKGESLLLLETTCARLGISKLPNKIADIILRYSRGIPRDVINLVEFISNNNPTLEEVQEFLGQVSPDVLADLLEASKDSVYSMSKDLDSLLLRFTTDIIVEQLKEFLVSAIFAVEGKTDELPLPIRKTLANLCDTKTLYQIVNLVEKLSSNSSESDLKLTMIHVSMLLQKRKLASVYTENNKQTSVQIATAEENRRDLEAVEKSGSVSGIGKLDLTSFKNWG